MFQGSVGIFLDIYIYSVIVWFRGTSLLNHQAHQLTT